MYVVNTDLKNKRLGEEQYNNSKCLMKIIKYNNTHDIVVEFQDKYKSKVHTSYSCFLKGAVKNPSTHVGEESYNNKGCLMKLLRYNNASSVVVEFQDKYKGKVHSSYQKFISGDIKNPYLPSVCGVGMIGDKYPSKINGKHLKEYVAWHGIIKRCYDYKYKQKHPTYKDATCCSEWLLFEKFYDWIHTQENFDKWYNGKQWNVDKDILIKNNKLYSPKTCCLVPNNVNKLFIRTNLLRGSLPIGISNDRGKFKVLCNNPFTKKCEYFGMYDNQFDAFKKYKEVKECFIKQVADIEYKNENITKDCYNAMMNYKVEITD